MIVTIVTKFILINVSTASYSSEPEGGFYRADITQQFLKLQEIFGWLPTEIISFHDSNQSCIMPPKIGDYTEICNNFVYGYQ